MVNLGLHGYTQQYFPAKSSPQRGVLRLLIEIGGKKSNPFINADIMHPEPQIPSKKLKYQFQLPFMGNTVCLLKTDSEIFPGSLEL